MDYLALALPAGVGGPCTVARKGIDPREAFDGLVHCPFYDCVMHYSNSIEDVDVKSATWCRDCAEKRPA